MAEIKTKPTTASVENYLNTIEDEEKRSDSFIILEMMKKATGETPALWGTSLVGFGNERIKSEATGREVDWFQIGFGPRKANLSLYMPGNFKKYDDLLNQLGKHKTGVGCLYIKRLRDIDINILEQLVKKCCKKL